MSEEEIQEDLQRMEELEDSSMTYQEWQDCGYYIIKGSKSRLRDVMGVPLFQKDQVSKARPNPKSYRGGGVISDIVEHLEDVLHNQHGHIFGSSDYDETFID